MADAALNGTLTVGNAYTVPSGKMAYVRMLGAADASLVGCSMTAGLVGAACAVVTGGGGGGLPTTYAAGFLAAIVPAGGVISVSGSGAYASYTGILRDV